MKINLDTSMKDRLLSQGCDIDTLYEKYSRGDSELDPHIHTQSSREKTSSSKIICHICHGIGITNKIYNHRLCKRTVWLVIKKAL